MADLLGTLKKAAMDAVLASNPAAMMFGEVTSTNPLEVLVDQRFTLPADFLILPESLTEHKVMVNGQETVIGRMLKAGDKLLLLRMQGGQQYLILDRVVIGSDS
ncbi:DUF2577 domain-containing protein [Paenibacillus popilliae]|uniref:DUF2577 domain-containing protein n=1 Tax=Paenibacillus popilliae ATCC 14706 TaxID=1212764 RepID=M9LHI2_PAEPP|nr:DUF2577 domain-containing protein [Paenibacillus popilliae]GAC42270.1 hypothetical protein PPOP_1627 [Paenibacillus popilliae ATCC 14706]